MLKNIFLSLTKEDVCKNFYCGNFFDALNPVPSGVPLPLLYPKLKQGMEFTKRQRHQTVVLNEWVHTFPDP